MWTHWECYVRPLSCFWGTNGCFCWPHRLPNDPTLRLESPTVRHVWGLVRHTFPTTGAYTPVSFFSLWCAPHQPTTPHHHTNTSTPTPPHQHTTPTHHPWCCGCRILAGTKLSPCHGGSFKLVGGVSPASELEMLLQCPPSLQQTNMPPTKTNISGGGTDIMTDITGSHASGGGFDEVLRLPLGVPSSHEQVPQSPCSPCFPPVVTSTAAMVTLSP